MDNRMELFKQKKKKKSKDSLNHNIQLIQIITLAIMGLLSVNVFWVTIMQQHFLSGESLKEYAAKANIQEKQIQATRGYIYDYNGEIIAQDIRTYNIVCILNDKRPSMNGEIAYVKDLEYTASMLAGPLGMSEEEILSYLTSGKEKGLYQTELGTKARNLSKETKDLIQSFNLPGIEFTDSIQRSYPLGTFASNLIGFAQTDESGSTVGKMGLELKFNQYLAGSNGYKKYQSDKNGFILPGMKVEETPAINGNNITLTLEKTVQEALEEAFQQTVNDFDVTRVWGAVSEIDTGRIVGWGQYPSFDPNVLDIEEYNDFGSQLPYEAGSTIKSIAWAAAMDTGNYDGEALVNSNDFYFTADRNNNPVRVNYNTGNRITNSRWKQYGWIPYDYGLILSANTIAASLITEVMTPETYEEYMDAFGLFKKTNAYGFDEATGVKVYNWSTDKITNTYGQGSTYTTLQLLQAYSAIFGDGSMKVPYVIESIKDAYDSQKVIYQGGTQISGQPISESTAIAMQALLERVVSDPQGTAKYYAIPECKVSGKTGTTQVIVDGSYESGYTINSVMLAFPAEDPQYMVYYAFEGPYDADAHYKTDAVTTLLRKVALYFNIIDDQNTNDGEEVSQEVDVNLSSEVTTFTMPNCVNHSWNYVNEQFADLNAQVVVIGQGDRVVNQYPAANTQVNSNTKVFLLMEANGFEMVDMTGWTRKDVTSLWELCGIDVKIEGLGRVIEQSIPPGTYVSKNDVLEIKLSKE